MRNSIELQQSDLSNSGEGRRSDYPLCMFMRYKVRVRWIGRMRSVDMFVSTSSLNRSLQKLALKRRHRYDCFNGLPLKLW